MKNLESELLMMLYCCWISYVLHQTRLRIK